MSTKPPFKPLVSTAERQRIFGKFDYVANSDGTIRILGGWANTNVVRVHIPQLEGVEGAPNNCVVYFHKLGAEQLKALFEEWDAEGLIDRVLTWGGSFVPRMIRGSKTALSNHAFGTAFDINAAWNGLGKEPAATGQKGSVVELVEIAHKHGFYWGANFTRKDGMHFEIAVLQSESIFEASQPILDAAEGETIQHSAAAASQRSDSISDAPLSQTASESSATPNASPAQSIASSELPQQTNEAGGSGQQIIVQPNATAEAAPVVKSPFDNVAEIASSGMGMIGKKLTWGTITGGGLAAAWAALQNNWIAVLIGFVFAMFLILVGAVIFLLAYHWAQKKKTQEAAIRSDPKLFNVKFEK